MLSSSAAKIVCASIPVAARNQTAVQRRWKSDACAPTMQGLNGLDISTFIGSRIAVMLGRPELAVPSERTGAALAPTNTQL